MTEWIIPCNISQYDIIGAFERFVEIEWKQSTNIQKGDIVYIYVGAPISAIKYRCKVLEVELPQVTIDDSEFVIDDTNYGNYGRYMRLHMLEEKDDSVLSRKYLMDNGLKSVQGPSKVTTELSKCLKLGFRSVSNDDFGRVVENVNTKEVLCLATGSTYEIVLKTQVTAHPAVAPYPSGNTKYLIPIKKGGTLEYMYVVSNQIECLPQEIYEYAQLLSKEEADKLIQYHELRNSSFGYGRKETKYKFYFLSNPVVIKQPFEKKGIQVSVRLDVSDVPLKENISSREAVVGKKKANSANMYIAITDTTWMYFIKEHMQEIGKYINFWTPGGRGFKALEPGELFLFKLHNNKARGENGEIVGGAFYDGFEKLSATEAWERFEIGNGASSLFEMQVTINEYRTKNKLEDTEEVGCIILKNPFFFEVEEWIEEPEDWGKFIVSGKTYSIETGAGADLYEKVNNYLKEDTDEAIIEEIESELESLQIEGKERFSYIKARVNQNVFRERLLKRYSNCCLCKVSNPDFLIASHIKPWAVSEVNEKLDCDNGLLLCPNHDALFDSGYISFKDDGTIMLSDDLKQIDAMFMNVDSSRRINLTIGNKKYMKYHRDKIFKK